MDKDIVILKYLQDTVSDGEKDLEDLKILNRNNEDRLDNAENKLNEIYKLLDIKKRTYIKEVKEDKELQPVDNKELYHKDTTKTESYDELYNIAYKELSSRGLDVDNLEYHNLVSEYELNKIINQLNRPLDRPAKWTKNDFIAVFIAASIGSLVDFIFSNRDNILTGQNSNFSSWLNKFHNHPGGAPIDYQGKGFGGGYHRGLSKGHDILRFIETIIMFKTGTFQGVRYINGIPNKVVSNVNQFGTPYEQLTWIEAILNYAKHMFGDLCSTCSLPFPGSSFLAECGNREFRKFAATMYQQGFNMKNIMVQSLSTIVVEVILRIYFSTESVKQYEYSLEVKEDYSNINAIKAFIKPVNKEKLQEMLLLAHSVVASINVGKVIITKKPWEINITEIMSVIAYAVPVVSKNISRYSSFSREIRNNEDILIEWQKLKLEFDDEVIKI